MRYWLAALLTFPLARGEAIAAPPPPPPEAALVPIALLVDLGSGRTLFERQADQRFLPASITKVMTAYVAFEEMANKRLQLAQKFTFAPASAAIWADRGSSLHLKAGEAVTVDMLLRGITTVSGNDASVVLAEGYSGSLDAWCRLMNAAARRLGMSQSHFATANGWPDKGATYVTARDLVRLGDALVSNYPHSYRRYFGQRRLSWNGVTQENHDPVTGVVAGADGIKTGHTNEAGFNFLGSAQRDGRRLMMVVAGVRAGADLAVASRALLEWGFAEWEPRPLFSANRPLAEAKVQGGSVRSVPLESRRAIQAVWPKGVRPAVTLTVSYRGPLTAPIAKGAQVAELEILVAGAPPSRVPLYAAEAVGPAGPFRRLVNGLAGFLT